MMIINEDFFDLESEEIDATITDDDAAYANTYNNSLTLYFNDNPKINTDYLKKCLSFVDNFHFSQIKETVDASTGGKTIEIKFDSEMSSLEEAKMLLMVIFKGTFYEVSKMVFDFGEDRQVKLGYSDVKELKSLFTEPEKMYYIRQFYYMSNSIKTLCNWICNKNEYSIYCFQSFEVLIKFGFPLVQYDYSYIAGRMEEFADLSGFENFQRYTIDGPKGITPRVKISYKKLFDFIDGLNYNKYKVQFVYIKYNAVFIDGKEKTISKNNHISDTISTFEGYNEMSKKKYFLLDEYAIYTAIKKDKDCNYKKWEIVLFFPFHVFYDKLDDKICYYYITIRWKLNDFPNHLKIANKMFDEIII